MGKSLYLECYSGISGDMTVAALLDLGADQKVLEDVLESIPVQGFEIKVSRVTKSGIDACDFDVILDAEIDGHDHDMEYLHGHDHSHTHGAEEYNHSHTHEAEEHNHSHTHMAEEHNHQYEHSHEAAAKNVAAHGHDHGDEIAAHTHEPHRQHKHRGMNEIRQIIGCLQTIWACIIADISVDASCLQVCSCTEYNCLTVINGSGIQFYTCDFSVFDDKFCYFSLFDGQIFLIFQSFSHLCTVCLFICLRS